MDKWRWMNKAYDPWVEAIVMRYINASPIPVTGGYMLFEVAILEKPTKQDAEKGVTERIVLAPTAVTAKDRDGAIVAALKSTTLRDVDTNRIDVLVRNFN